MKTDITAQIKEHIEWLTQRSFTKKLMDPKSLISFMNNQDNTKHLQKFNPSYNQLDTLEMKVFTMYSELAGLKQYAKCILPMDKH